VRKAVKVQSNNKKPEPRDLDEDAILADLFEAAGMPYPTTLDDLLASPADDEEEERSHDHRRHDDDEERRTPER